MGSAAQAVDSYDSARFLCALTDGSGLSSKPCDIGSGTVTLTLDMNETEARKTCGQLANIMASNGHQFGPGWRLQINSPTGPLTFCSLR